MPACAFHAPPRFHPGYSLLGRWLRRRTGDARYAEALHVLLLTGFALALLFLHFLGDALLDTQGAAQPSTWWIYGISMAGLVGLGLATGVVGFRSGLTVTCTVDALQIAQGPRTLTLPYAALASVRRVTARRFHRHERRYAATRAFLGVLQDEVLLLRTSDAGPVVIGLPEDELDALQAHLETAACETTRAPMHIESASVKGRADELEKG